MAKKEEKSDLQRSEERIRSFMEKSAVAIYCFELEQPIDISLPINDQVDLIYRHAFIAEANDTCAQLAGFERGADMEGLHLTEIMPRTFPENVTQLKRLIRAQYNLANLEFIEVCPSGK
jgi:PAS domain-containing protein